MLSLPWLDRTIAAVACVPLVYVAYYRYVQDSLPPRLSGALEPHSRPNRADLIYRTLPLAEWKGRR